ncbi:MAG: hypothetical protein Q9227_006264 [Pyrenula ochraceoflavens]
MSVAYRERERERDRWDDSRTTVSRREGGYTTVKRYRIPGDDDAHSSMHSREHRGSDHRSSDRVEETRIIRRERERSPEPPRTETRDLVIRREREVEEPRKEYVVERRREEPSTERDIVIRRTTEREEPRYERYEREVIPRPVEREYRYERDYDALSPPARPYDLQKYSRSTEYFQPPPQTIVIRQEPQHIYINQERARDDNDFQLVQRSDVEDRQVARRESPKNEEYFYEKKVKEVERPRRDDDYYEERRVSRREREVSPHDSVSQVGGRRDRDYSSDDDMVYVRKEKRVEEGSRHGFDRSESPHHRRHLAEGALAGIGAAELMRHHHKKEGKESSGTLGRVGKDVGAGVLGAGAATAISRARSRYRSKSRRRDRSDSRSRSRSRDRGRHRSKSRRRSRSRSNSHSRLKTLGGIGLGAAALATAVAVARSRAKSPAVEERRSRSRRRRDSSSDVSVNVPDDARSPSHRNKRMAEAGLAGAAVAGLVERARSKSRARKGEKDGKDRSRSRIRQGLPIVATGLGSAAIAGLYEKNKAKNQEKEAEKVAKTEKRARSRRRSRSRSTMYSDAPRSATMSDPGLIEYGDDPVYGNIPAADYYGRPAAHQQYGYPDAGAVVPAAGAAGYAAARGQSRDRRRSSSSEDSGAGRRRRRHRKNRSQSRDLATAGAAAGAAAIAANEYGKKKERKRAEKERRRYEAEHAHDPYEESYDPAPFTPSPPPPNAGYGQENQFYPQTNAFPPPPGTAPQAYAQQPYNPGDYPPPPGAVPQAQPGYNPTYPASGQPAADPYAGGNRRADENVSAAANPSPDQHHQPQDGVNSTQMPYMSGAVPVDASRSAPQQSSKRNVQFDLGSEDASRISESSPDQRRHRRREQRQAGYETDDSDSTLDGNIRNGSDQPTPISPGHGQRRHKHRHHRSRDDDPHPLSSTSTPSTSSPAATENPSSKDKHRNRLHRRHRSDLEDDNTKPSSHLRPDSGVPESPASDSTIDLPERFDKHGRKKPEPGDDPLADKIDDLLSGKGPGSKFFGKLTGGLFSGRGDGDEGGEGSGRRRR